MLVTAKPSFRKEFHQTLRNTYLWYRYISRAKGDQNGHLILRFQKTGLHFWKGNIFLGFKHSSKV
jgi:hypothetical protein